MPGVFVLGIGTAAGAVEVVRTSMPRLDAQQQQPAAPAPVPQQAVNDAGSLATAFRAASANAIRGVVFVRVEMEARAVSNRVPPQFRGTPFEQFFGPGGGEEPREEGVGSGSGFIISPDGYILTNNHVVSGASRVTVTLPDKREFTARVVGRDPNTDVAVVKVDATNLPTVQLGSADNLQTGDWVLALGYPLSLGQTTTAGIVSAKGKSIGIMDQNRGATRPLEHFIQTDAVINPGNSGGPLINLRGQVVGINSAIASPTGYYAGYGFAVPIDIARRVANDLIRYGNVRRPMIGVQIKDATAADQQVFRLPAVAGAVVAQEPMAGPARDAGLRMGDVIVAVDNQPIADTGDLMERVARKQPGDVVTVDIVRYGKRQRVQVRLGTMQTASKATSQGGDDEVDARRGLGSSRLGLRVEVVDPASARQYGLRNGGGLIVTEVNPMSPAAAAVPRGFRIERINGQAVSTPAELDAAVAKLRSGDVVSLVGRDTEGNATITNFRVR